MRQGRPRVTPPKGRAGLPRRPGRGLIRAMDHTPFPLDAEDIWCQVLAGTPETFHGRPALFLDRDGVVVEEVHFLSRPEDARLIPGAARVIARANAQDVAVVLVTNQGGIAYGYYDWPDFAAVQARIVADLAAAGARLDAVYACPFHTSGRAPYVHPDHPARKPNPGMVLRGIRDLGLDGARSWIVGDRATDLAAGRNAGLAGGLHVRTGHGTGDDEAAKALAVGTDGFTALGAPSIDAADGLLPLFAE